MKKLSLILFMLGFFVTACDEDFDDLNTNTKDPIAVSGESLFTSAQKNVVDQMTSTNVNENVFRLFSQHWTQTTYTDESNYDLITRSIPEQFWSALYRDALKNFDEAKTVLESTGVSVGETEAQYQNKLQIIEIMSVYTYAVLVETFGNIPYSQAMDIEVLTPAYDDAETIYMDLLSRLDVAISSMNSGAGSFGVADNIYNGDADSWVRFANTLKLKMAMLLADSNPTFAATAAAEAMTNAFTSNADNATMIYESAVPNTNPLYEDLELSGRNDFVPSSSLVDMMNNYSDPRRSAFFTVMSDGAYLGGTPGASNSYGNYSHISEAIAEDPTFPALLLDYSEVQFLLAEAVDRGFISGSAEEYYYAGIKASCDYWGVSDDDYATYITQADVEYSSASWDEKIGKQQWIAYYNRGFSAWRSVRRLDYPELPAPEAAVSDFPLRWTYPIVEQTLNGDSWSTASSAIGGDVVTSALFWDINQ